MKPEHYPTAEDARRAALFEYRHQRRLNLEHARQHAEARAAVEAAEAEDAARQHARTAAQMKARRALMD